MEIMLTACRRRGRRGTKTKCLGLLPTRSSVAQRSCGILVEIFFSSLNRIWNYQLSHLANKWFCETVFQSTLLFLSLHFSLPFGLFPFCISRRSIHCGQTTNASQRAARWILIVPNVVWLTGKESKCQTGRKTAICSANCRSARTDNKF